MIFRGERSWRSTGHGPIANARSFVSRANEPLAPADFVIARRMSVAFWLIGLAVAAALVLFEPPTRSGLGDWGWAVAGGMFAAAAAITIRRLDADRQATPLELYLSGFAAIAMIAILEWLAGGWSTPYHHLYWLPILYGAGAHMPKRVLLLFTVVTVIVWLPLVYDGYSDQVALGIATQLVMFGLVGTAVWVMFVVLRKQRAEIRARRARAEAMALEDELTGLGNRRAFTTAIETEIARAERVGFPLSIVLADLDSFKEVNDRLGHLTGDDVLRRTALRILNASRDGDSCYRWGGDEFAILLPHTTAAEAEIAAGRLSAAVNGIVLRKGPRLSLSYGIAEWRPGMNVQQLTQAADYALLGSSGEGSGKGLRRFSPQSFESDSRAGEQT